MMDEQICMILERCLEDGVAHLLEPGERFTYADGSGFVENEADVPIIFFDVELGGKNEG